MQRITLNQCDAGWGWRLTPAQFDNYIVDSISDLTRKGFRVYGRSRRKEYSKIGAGMCADFEGLGVRGRGKLTTDELFALGLERTRILAAMIDNGRAWYLGRRMRRPEGMISGYFDPKRGLGIDYFRKTIRHLANSGFKKVNMKSDAAVAFRKGNEHVLALLRELEPLLAQHVGKEDANAYRLALYFFRSGQDMFFDMLPRFEPILRPTIRKMKVEAFCIDSLQRYLGAVARAFAIREAQLTGNIAPQASKLPTRKPPTELSLILSNLREIKGMLHPGFQQGAKLSEKHRYEVSISDAAEALNMSTSQIKQWDKGLLPAEFKASYPGRFLRIPFYQWANAYAGCLKFSRSIHNHTVLMTHPELVADKQRKPA